MTRDLLAVTAERCLEEAAGLGAVLGYRQRKNRKTP